MRGLDRTPDLDGNAQNFRHRNTLGPISGAQRRGAQLHHQIGAAVGGDARLVHGQDRRMRRKLGHEVGLGLEHLSYLLVDDLAEHDLDRDLASWHVLFIEKDIGETTRAQDVNVREAG
jgi:hypothetical protein